MDAPNGPYIYMYVQSGMISYIVTVFHLQDNGIFHLTVTPDRHPNMYIIAYEVFYVTLRYDTLTYFFFLAFWQFVFSEFCFFFVVFGRYLYLCTYVRKTVYGWASVVLRTHGGPKSHVFPYMLTQPYLVPVTTFPRKTYRLEQGVRRAIRMILINTTTCCVKLRV